MNIENVAIALLQTIEEDSLDWQLGARNLGDVIYLAEIVSPVVRPRQSRLGAFSWRAHLRVNVEKVTTVAAEEIEEGKWQIDLWVSPGYLARAPEGDADFFYPLSFKRHGEGEYYGGADLLAQLIIPWRQWFNETLILKDTTFPICDKMSVDSITPKNEQFVLQAGPRQRGGAVAVRTLSPDLTIADFAHAFDYVIPVEGKTLIFPDLRGSGCAGCGHCCTLDGLSVNGLDLPLLATRLHSELYAADPVAAMLLVLERHTITHPWGENGGPEGPYLRRSATNLPPHLTHLAAKKGLCLPLQDQPKGCKFLDRGFCGIWQDRPLVCRTYLCAPGSAPLEAARGELNLHLGEHLQWLLARPHERLKEKYLRSNGEIPLQEVLSPRTWANLLAEAHA